MDLSQIEFWVLFGAGFAIGWIVWDYVIDRFFM